LDLSFGVGDFRSSDREGAICPRFNKAARLEPQNNFVGSRLSVTFVTGY